MLKYEIYLDDAQRGVYEIKQAREAALKNPLYQDLVDIKASDQAHEHVESKMPEKEEEEIQFDEIELQVRQ